LGRIRFAFKNLINALIMVNRLFFSFLVPYFNLFAKYSYII
jgi:hypothetical protein